MQHADHPDRIAVSAGGDAAAFAVGPTPGGPTEATGLWYGPLSGQPAKISDLVPDTNLAFAPQGSAFALAVHDGEGSRLIVADPAAGQAGWAEHRLPVFAEQVTWTADGLVVLAADPGADTASLTSGKPLAGEAEDPVVARAAAGWRRLWLVDAATGTATPVSPDDLAVWEFAPVPGGGAVVVGSDDPSEAGWYHSSLIVLDAAGQRTRVLRESPWQLSSPTVSPDGQRVAYVEGWASDRGLLAGEVQLSGLDGTGTRTPPTSPSPFIADVDVTWLSWAADGRLWLAGWHHLGTAWGWASCDGRPEVMKGEGEVGGSWHSGGSGGVAPPNVTVQAASCLNSRWHPEVVPLPDGTVLTMRSTPELPPEVVRLRRGGEAVPWTSVNARLAGSRHLRVRELRWKAADGTEIEGLLAEPAGTATGPVPLVADIHGGPSLAWHHSWDLPWAEVLTAAGYAVLLANPRGSVGRGQAFARANLGDPVGAEFDDILAGIARCVDDGIADPSRVAAIGASYGGYLTAWAIAGGTTFRCGVVIAGMSDLVSCWGTANNPPFYDYLLQGRPSEHPALYLERSPVTRLGAASVPTLILHGLLDRCVPVGQAEELHAGLRRLGVPVEFVTYPREGHSVREPAHVADQRERVLSWFETHLGGSS
jgi:dipeptidyl aminopeptidase/acylaminoacyl peptidase